MPEGKTKGGDLGDSPTLETVPGSKSAQHTVPEDLGLDETAVALSAPTNQGIGAESGNVDQGFDATLLPNDSSDAVKRYQLIYGNEHRVTANAQAWLCNYQRRAKQYSAARGSCTKALAVLDPDAPDPRDLALVLTYAAWLDLQEGKKGQALERAQRAWRLRLEHTSLPSSEGQTRFVLGLALQAAGQPEDARKHVEAAKRTIAEGEPGTMQDIPEIDAFLASSAL